MDTLFADISEYQVVANDSYPYKFISIRSNDGTYRDKHFAANLKWAKAAVKSGKLLGYIVYFVWEPNWLETVNTLKAMVGAPDPHMAVMIDVESWGGRIKGDHSIGINGARENVIAWLGGNRKRVFGYGNAHDLMTIWPKRGDSKVILANYSDNPPYPGKIAHQFSSSFVVAPFGKCDINSADGIAPDEFARLIGVNVPLIKPKPKPEPHYPHKDQPSHDHALVSQNGAYALILQDDGRVELRHNGKHVRNL